MKMMGLLIEHRGKDASGVMTVSPTKRIKNRKSDVAMSDFLKQHRQIGAGAQVCLIHTRAWTQGSPKNQANNHPIEYGDVIGVHNGMISNDADIWATYPDWKQNAEVDSEVIFASLHHLPLVEALENIDGSMVTAFIRKDDPLRLFVARGWANPVHFVRSQAGSLFFGSTEETALYGAQEAGLQATEEHVYTISSGTIVSATPTKGSYASLTEGFDHTGMRAPYVSHLHKGWKSGYSAAEAAYYESEPYVFGSGKGPTGGSPTNVHYLGSSKDLKELVLPASASRELGPARLPLDGVNDEWDGPLADFLDGDDGDPFGEAAEIKENMVVRTWIKGQRIEGIVTDVIGDVAIVEWFPSEISTSSIFPVEHSYEGGTH